MIGRREKPPVMEEEKLKGFDDFDLRLGDVMRGERATLGKSLLDVQRDLKIKASYIAAIENSDPSSFETQGFVAGYVRSYARYLGLDPEWAYSRFCNESNFATADGISSGASAKAAKKPKKRAANRDPLVDPDVVFIPKGESLLARVDPGALGSVLVMIMLISAIGYGGWSVFREIQKVQFVPVDQTPTISTGVDVLAGNELDPSPEDAGQTPIATAEALNRLYRPNPLEAPVLVARDSAISTLRPNDIGTLAPTAPSQTLPDTTFATNITPEISPAPEVQVREDVSDQVILFAVRPSWVRVRGADGTVLFEKILDAGEEYALPLTEVPPELRAGNAGSVYFTINGQTYGPAGTGPSVVKGVSLAAEALMAQYQPADAASDADLARFIAVAQAQTNE